MVKKEARGWGRPPEEINGHARLPRYMEVLAGKSMRYGGPETLWNHQYGRDGPEAVVVLDAANQKPQCLKLIQEGLHAAFNGDHIESERP
jgi:hypothetical protein